MAGPGGGIQRAHCSAHALALLLLLGVWGWLESHAWRQRRAVDGRRRLLRHVRHRRRPQLRHGHRRLRLRLGHGQHFWQLRRHRCRWEEELWRCVQRQGDQAGGGTRAAIGAALGKHVRGSLRLLQRGKPQRGLQGRGAVGRWVGWALLHGMLPAAVQAGAAVQAVKLSGVAAHSQHRLPPSCHHWRRAWWTR